LSLNTAKKHFSGPASRDRGETCLAMVPFPDGPSATLPDRLRFILARRGLSLAKVSRASRSLLPEDRLSHIPHNFYSSLRNRRFSPSLYQLLALSSISGYRLTDWLTVFGLSLDDIPRFHASLPALRTAELDAGIYHTGALIPWFYDLRKPDFSVPLGPLSHWLASGAPRRFDSLPHTASAAYRYFKIGSRDAVAFPDLLPGSIVRVRRNDVGLFERLPVGSRQTKRLFLVEHSNGLACSRLYRSKSRKLVLCSRQLPYAPVELHQGSEAVILGTADLEIRRLVKTERPVVPSRLGHFWTPAPLLARTIGRHFGEFIRRARLRSGFSFREASERSRWIARELGDARYYCAPGSLSDYETRKLPPRHIHKLISICAVYFASAADLIAVSGASVYKAGNLAMPTEFLRLPPNDGASSKEPSHFVEGIRRRLRDLPYFLRSAAASLFGLPDLSLRDVFWAGGLRNSKHSYLNGALFLIVDRRRKTPRRSLSSPIWAQPAYVLQRRDGRYLCGLCHLQSGTLVLSSCFTGQPKLLRLRNRVDAEVIGRVVGIVRRLA
jgi:transcriptional regulator with XRE-family HTH domain